MLPHQGCFAPSLSQKQAILTNSLIIGFGNLDRQDDGVAWHILAALARQLGRQATDSFEDEFEFGSHSPELLFVLQLTPELAETIAQYDRVCFVDAHTGNVPEEVHAATLSIEFQNSPFTHHMTPETCLALAQTLYGNAPEALLVSVRGYEFGFSRSLSTRTQEKIEDALVCIWDWLQATNS